jgi:hypothetical protein
MLTPLFANVTADKRSVEQCFNQSIAQVYSKTWSAELLRKFLTGWRRGNESLTSKMMDQRLLTSSPTENWLCTEHEIGVAADSLDAALAAIGAIRARGHHKIIVKQAVGLAGSNAMRLFELELLEPHRRWMANSLASGRQLVIEPWLERLIDFSVQLEMTTAGLKLCGYTGLLNDAKGQFQGDWAESHHHTRIPARVVSLFREPPNISCLILQLYADIFILLEAELRRAGYLGPLGIDAFVYRDAAGQPRLKPIVEINPRYTMGRVTVELMRQTCQGSFGLFHLLNRARLRREGFDEFAAYARALTERFPLQLEGEPAPRIREGAICINEPAQAQACLAVFRVGRTPAPLLSDHNFEL